MGATMRERGFPCTVSPIRAVLVFAAIVLCGALGFASGASAANGRQIAITVIAATAQDGATVPDSSSPETNPPDEPEPQPDETPDETEPQPDETPDEPEPQPDETPDETDPQPDPPDADDDNLVAEVIAIVGFTLLVGVAGWWMASRRDIDDDSPPRPTPDEGVAGRDLI
jgi:type IV secretory pathway VirB10-like protein